MEKCLLLAEKHVNKNRVKELCSRQPLLCTSPNKACKMALTFTFKFMHLVDGRDYCILSSVLVICVTEACFCVSGEISLWCNS